MRNGTRLVCLTLIFMCLNIVRGQSATQPAGKEPAQAKAAEEASCGAEEGDYLTGDWGGARTKLEDRGIIFSLAFTSVYQNNVHGGADTTDAQRITGRYDLDLTLDLEKLFKVKGGELYTLAEGGFGDGLDGAEKVGDLFGVNYNTVGFRSLDVLELWYLQKFLEDKIQFKVGKIDLTGTFECRGCPVSFDGNSYANDESSQFMNYALRNNPTIPFPENGLGAVLHLVPLEWFYMSAGAADAQADYRMTGFHSAFHDEDYYIFLYEFGFVPHIPTKKGPLVGAYRFGLWYDPQPKEIFFDNYDSDLASRYKRDDVGFYVSFDQAVFRENDKDDQGVGLFFRYGFAPGESNQVENFWSVGGQYKGIVPRRDEDVLGFGVAQGILSGDLGYYRNVRPGRETLLELYYNIKIARGLYLSPDVQCILDPGGRNTGRDCTIVGLRVQMNL